MKYIFYLLFPTIAFSQPNCNVYLYNRDTLQYNACKSVEEVPYYQYTRKYQERYDKALEICPYFAHAYASKSTAYLKSGDFVTWKYLIDKAVQYDTLEHIGYRGWCRYQFFRDYKGAISDIEYLEKRKKSINIGFSAAGDYHLIVAKAICYSAINDKKKAIEILENLFANTKYAAGEFDFYQLGVTYFQIKDYKNAQKYFDKQSAKNELAENKYYKAKIAKIKGDQLLYQSEIKEAIRLYKANQNMTNPYTEHFNKVYLSTITSE
jgi:tetratricopeptide (TPR) repeat protein